ncbi:WecB/TagA/CpsF family glycosyltransferase [Heliophilum fasciatum]|uniref:N-acetylglucosaminyldiphosphoundecaprenol N-acetyl-beta-D-mannosaminyltransferase n=1 Tax=Heliophilum fasciatum TaxID=35700 RepID=A0A4R2RZ08_9FIRM|nr:WecB/TagA/CpsF family glycosyltransferase [Heliophilum fasciatum]MCW2277458.1 N-acetylglucosaminyldiphosphoundecaprenol N-acetyl-beta-D-mannosaminyltransferase [Heliophilum fasciatum]TCP65251.1 N-acetylglucosaminyldiphosphoundecaprenol N-acetyl-beta-D-mannosaminyltransferase [Heliophilum fasciatum]
MNEQKAVVNEQKAAVSGQKDAVNEPTMTVRGASSPAGSGEPRRVNILGAPVDSLTMEQAIASVEALLAAGGVHHVVTANPEILYGAQTDTELRQILHQASLVTADGIGVVWAASWLGQPVPARITGIDLMEALLVQAAHRAWPCFFLGGAPGVAETAAARMSERHRGLVIAGTQHGYFAPAEEPAVIKRICAAQPKLLFVGLGAPRQEKWIAAFARAQEQAQAQEQARQPQRPQLQQQQTQPRQRQQPQPQQQPQQQPQPQQAHPRSAMVAIGIGGSMDVLAGNVRRAPAWVQAAHIEWLYRLLSQPKRIGRQLKLPLFALAVMGQKNGQGGPKRQL